MNTIYDLAWETVNNMCGTKYDDWRGMSIEQIKSTLVEYSIHLIEEGQPAIDKISERATAIFEAVNQQTN